MFFDSTFILVLPVLLFALYAQSRVRGAFDTYSRVASTSRLGGAEVARQLLRNAGLDNVRVERTNRALGDHYDPRQRILRLSPGVYESNSVAALGVAAHEVGHAIQHHTGYYPLNLRNSLVPVAGFGSSAAFPLFLIGLFIDSMGLMNLGIVLFGAAVLFHVVTLPVEKNASSRALALLESGGFITSREVPPTRAVLDAAALTYLAATAMAVAQLLRLLVLRDSRRR
ncbi:MAG: zinc metallopeptidase [Bacillota bacterium]